MLKRLHHVPNLCRSLRRAGLFLLPLALPLAPAACGAVQAAPSSQRPPRVNDQFAAEQIGSVTFSPDGAALAFTRRRPTESMPTFNAMLHKEILDDVWIQEGAGRPPRNLTNGIGDGSGWWKPAWSADGRYLAMFSTRGGNVTPWVWDRSTQQLRQLTTEGVEIESDLKWLDAQHVLCLLRPEGETNPPYFHGRKADAAMKAWNRALTGATTASVLNSNEFVSTARRLVSIDAGTGQVVPIAQVRVTQVYYDDNLGWKLAPGGRVLSVVRPLAVRYGQADQERLGVPVSIELRDLQGREMTLRQPFPNNVLATTVQWSSDGGELAFFAYGDAPINPALLYGANAAAYMPEFVKNPRMSLANPARLYRVNVARGTLESWDTGDLDLGYLSAPRFRWTAQGELLFRAARRMAQWRELNNVPRTNNAYSRIGYGPRAPRGWWVLGRDGNLRPLTTKLKDLPEYLHTVDGGSTFIGVSAGDVWRIDSRTGAVKNLTASFAPAVAYILQEFVQSENRGAAGIRIVLSAGRELTEGDRDDIARGLPDHVKPDGIYALEIDSGKIASLERPAPQADLSAYSTGSDAAAWTADDGNGTFLWRSGAASQNKAEAVVQTNLWKQGVMPLKCQVVDYTSLDGAPLHAQLCLPTDYKPGQRVPLVVNLYLTRTGMASRSDEGSLEHYVGKYPSAGYAVLVPDMPKNLPGLDEEEGQSILSLPNGVHPAVDKVIALGIADPERLFIEGISNGGWSVAALLAQTTRFKAALARSGMPIGEGQVANHCGALGSGLFFRYQPDAHRNASPAGACKYLNSTDLPWWRDRYRNGRNDPINYVERVQTPLLLTHSDLDDIESSERFFNALVSMRKPAQFVRYWGEAHGRDTPANIRDEFQRTLAWFDDFGDISRDAAGRMIFAGDRVQSRGGKPALEPQDYAGFDVFGPGGEAGNR